MRLVFICIVLFFAIPCHADSDAEIKKLVYKWNDFHNSGSVAGMEKLFAPSVLFYGKYRSLSNVIQSKKKLLASGFSQNFISEIKLTEYKSGIIRADFRKRTLHANTINEHDCYLLFKKYGNQYLIEAESDLETDREKKVGLILGEALPSTKNNHTVLFTIIGAVVLGLLLFLFQSKKRVPVNNHSDREKAFINVTRNLYNRPFTPEFRQQSDKDIAKLKGDQFEKYVIDRFDKNHFKLQDWRSDKIHNGVYAESSKHPDLVYEFSHHSTFVKPRFAVECKYRSGYDTMGKVRICREDQLRNYNEYSKKNQNIPVFVVLGLAGIPSLPDELYIIPLKMLK